jgi:hypothetical protein
MEPEQALNVLDQAASAYQGSRQDHLNIHVAVNVLRGILPAPKAATTPKEDGPSDEGEQRKDGSDTRPSDEGEGQTMPEESADARDESETSN